MRLRFKVSLLLFIGFQSIALVSQGSSDLSIQRRHVEERSNFFIKDTFWCSSKSKMSKSSYNKKKPKVIVFSVDPLDLKFSKEDTVIVMVGNPLDSKIENNTNLVELVRNKKIIKGMRSCLICQDETGKRADCYIYNYSIDDNFILDNISFKIASDGKKNIIFRHSKNYMSPSGYIENRYKEVVARIADNIQGIENIGIYCAYNDSATSESCLSESFKQIFCYDWDNKLELDFYPDHEDLEDDLITDSSLDTDLDSNITPENSSRESSWFSFFKRPVIVISFITAAGVCLGTFYLFKRGFFLGSEEC